MTYIVSGGALNSTHSTHFSSRWMSHCTDGDFNASLAAAAFKRTGYTFRGEHRGSLTVGRWEPAACRDRRRHVCSKHTALVYRVVREKTRAREV